LADHGDLPAGRCETAIQLCPPNQAANIFERAHALGVAESFMACLPNGFFFTRLGKCTRARSSPRDRRGPDGAMDKAGADGNQEETARGTASPSIRFQCAM
jgi:hypothetical protein